MNKLSLIAAISCVVAAPCSAQLATFDFANLSQSLTNYLALTEQISNQATQISNQIQQIKHVETQLQRMGDMASVQSLVGFVEYRSDLDLPNSVKLWADTLALVDGRGIFGDTRGGIYPSVEGQFVDFDGTSVDRDPLLFKQPHEITATVDDFKTVQSDVYRRRADLKTAITHTSEAMQAASTEAEQQKLAAVLQAQYGQLTAVDAEVALSAAEVQVKAAEATAMQNAQTSAEAETRKVLAQQEAKKISNTFKPQYECLLQYVSERSLAP